MRFTLKNESKLALEIKTFCEVDLELSVRAAIKLVLSQGKIKLVIRLI